VATPGREAPGGGVPGREVPGEGTTKGTMFANDNTRRRSKKGILEAIINENFLQTHIRH
jgi:hypothetical protein